MCLVEVERSPKPVASWYVAIDVSAHRDLQHEVIFSAMPAMPGAKVFTNTPMVHEARSVIGILSVYNF
jgi:NADH dehydrogenase (ubiquinone) Fe-S protein 1